MGRGPINISKSAGLKTLLCKAKSPLGGPGPVPARAPNWAQKWTKRGARTGPEWCQNQAGMGPEPGQNGARTGPEWSQNWARMGPELGQNGARTGPEWSQDRPRTGSEPARNWTRPDSGLDQNRIRTGLYRIPKYSSTVPELAHSCTRS